MTLLRTTARSLLASYFVVSGVKAVRNPELLVTAAEPLTDRFVPLAKQYAPAQVADRIPEDTATLVRVNGAAQVLGGLALATGNGRRLGAGLLAATLVPSTLAKHPYWQRTTPEERAIDKAHFLKNSSLLGGLLLAIGDTEGKPSLAWRAQRGTKTLAKDTKALAKDTRHAADSALAEGAMLVGTVVAGSRKARKNAAKELKAARKAAERRADAAIRAGKQARKDARQLARSAKKQQTRRQVAAARRSEARTRAAATAAA